jgi:integrase
MRRRSAEPFGLFQRADSPSWFCYVPKPGGGTRKVSTECADKRSALARAAELERDALDPDGEAAKTKTVRDALELLIRERLARAKATPPKGSMETVGFYQKKAGALLDGLAATLSRSPKAKVMLSEVKSSLVDDYIKQRREDEVGENTIAKELTTWTLAMRLAKRRRWWRADIDEVFPKGFSPEYEPRERFVTPDEFVKLQAAMVRPAKYRTHGLSDAQVAELRARHASGERWVPLAKEYGIALSTLRALRINDWVTAEGPEAGHVYFAIVCFSIATSAEWSAIWRARRADIKAELTKVFVRGSKNKRRKREVPIALLAFGYLLEYAARHADGGEDGAGGAFVFSASHASSFRRTLAEACVRAGIPHLCPTDLRRTHSKWLRLSGVELGNIFPSMGHADDRMLQRVYAQSTAMELAHLQAAQIAAAPGMLLGGQLHSERSQNTPESAHDPSIPSELQCPDTESNCGHGDFQSPSTARTNPSETTKCASSWEATGIIASSERSGPGEAKELPEDAADPPPIAGDARAVGVAGADAPSMGHPGVARVASGAERVRLEVDGAELVQTDVCAGEPVADVEARLKLAVGQKGGLR